MTVSLKIALCSMVRQGSSAASLESESPSFCSSPRVFAEIASPSIGAGSSTAAMESPSSSPEACIIASYATSSIFATAQMSPGTAASIST